jgi:hypothetical protein
MMPKTAAKRNDVSQSIVVAPWTTMLTSRVTMPATVKVTANTVAKTERNLLTFISQLPLSTGKRLELPILRRDGMRRIRPARTFVVGLFAADHPILATRHGVTRKMHKFTPGQGPPRQNRHPSRRWTTSLICSEPHFWLSDPNRRYEMARLTAV